MVWGSKLSFAFSMTLGNSNKNFTNCILLFLVEIPNQIESNNIDGIIKKPVEPADGAKLLKGSCIF